MYVAYYRISRSTPDVSISRTNPSFGAMNTSVSLDGLRTPINTISIARKREFDLQAVEQVIHGSTCQNCASAKNERDHLTIDAN